MLIAPGSLLWKRSERHGLEIDHPTSLANRVVVNQATEPVGTKHHAVAAPELDEGQVDRHLLGGPELLREEIAQTVGGPDEIDGEIHNLFDTLNL